jgi:hypothetical protein
MVAARGMMFMFAPPTLVGTNALAPPYRIVKGEWIDPT